MDVLARISALRTERQWSEYELAQRADIPQSTISTWYRKKTLPTLTTLQKICNAFEISISAFYNDQDYVITNDKQKQLLEYWNQLNSHQQEQLLNFLESITMK